MSILQRQVWLLCRIWTLYARYCINLVAVKQNIVLNRRMKMSVMFSQVKEDIFLLLCNTVVLF